MVSYLLVDSQTYASCTTLTFISNERRYSMHQMNSSQCSTVYSNFYYF